MKRSAFTLVEIMIALAIVGILAAIAVPNVRNYVARSRQNEVRVNLKNMWAAGLSYLAENGTIDRGHIMFKTAPVVPRYSYHMAGNGGPAGFIIPGTSTTMEDCFNDHPPEFDSMATERHLFVAACGNIDSDTNMDWWVYTHDGGLQNVRDDVTNTARPIVGLNAGPLVP